MTHRLTQAFGFFYFPYEDEQQISNQTVHSEDGRTQQSRRPRSLGASESDQGCEY
jgi:hypothetical protein